MESCNGRTTVAGRVAWCEGAASTRCGLPNGASRPRAGGAHALRRAPARGGRRRSRRALARGHPGLPPPAALRGHGGRPAPRHQGNRAIRSASPGDGSPAGVSAAHSRPAVCGARRGRPARGAPRWSRGTRRRARPDAAACVPRRPDRTNGTTARHRPLDPPGMTGPLRNATWSAARPSPSARSRSMKPRLGGCCQRRAAARPWPCPSRSPRPERGGGGRGRRISVAGRRGCALWPPTRPVRCRGWRSQSGSGGPACRRSHRPRGGRGRRGGCRRGGRPRHG